jgi:8-oxo-dGTP pyrophosphatase MutT (NUDIX family)
MRPRVYPDLLGFVRAACTHASRAGSELPVIPFYVKEHAVGWLRPSFADLLRRWPHVFEVNPAYVRLCAKPDTAQGRSAAMAEVTRELTRDGAMVGWRDELVSVSANYGEPELFRIERAATRYFGFLAYAAHMNGFTRRRGLAHAWIARRSPAKQIDPDKLDNLVGGRIAAGMSVDETLRKEAWEEAGLAPSLLAGLNCLGAVRVEYSVPEGLHREILFVHDLWLPEDYKPANQDGEVAAITCMPVEEVLENIFTGDFTLDAGVVMIDGLLRLGAMLPEDPQYLDLLRLMKP